MNNQSLSNTEQLLAKYYAELDTLAFDSDAYCELEEKISRLESGARGQSIENGEY